ncbi:MAG: pyridoxamine 5'-phosphate oxidase family protein [Rhodobacteraceae bacterium]|nr:pyridoxamine 5'-phosphate oxidase family protein [Paracoccaceae bacterium]
MLDKVMIRIIEENTAGMVATIASDGSPAVSPKGTFVVADPSRIAFGNIRSPGTISNLHRDPRVQICFLDVLARKAVRIVGVAKILPKAATPQDVVDCFENLWPEYLPSIKEFVIILVNSAELILSPAYDLGHSEEQLRSAYRKRIVQT